MDGTFDAEAFSSGNYVLAVGPAIDRMRFIPPLPVPSVGSTIELAGKSYEVMAVVYPLMPVTDGAAEMGAFLYGNALYPADRHLPGAVAGKYFAKIICKCKGQ